MKKPRPKPGLERIALIGILFIIQVVWIFVIFTNIINYSVALETVLTIFSVGMILYLVTKDENPAYRLSWIILITLFPIFGGLMYFFMGNKRPAYWMQKRINDQAALHLNEMIDMPHAEKIIRQKDERLSGLTKYLRDNADAPVYTNNDVEYYPNGESMMEPLLADLEKAEKTIFIEFFIVEFGEMFDAIIDVLKRKAEEGVDIRFIYDDFGSITRLPANYNETLEKMGIKALKFNPVRPILSLVYNTRDHRKFIIIDGEIAYTGGLNIADEYINVKERFGYWKDNMIRVYGPAVWNYTTLFLNMWNAFRETDESYESFKPHRLIQETYDEAMTVEASQEKGFVQPFGDTPLDSQPVGENVYRDILSSATDYVYIYTPYLVISYELQTAMTLAARRGVDVRLMTPGIPDKKLVFRMTRSFYRPLLRAGVRIFEYSPGFLHAKTFISDDKVATVGTINLDYRSLYLHFETNTVLYYHPVIQEIKTDYLLSEQLSRQVGLSDIRQSFIGEIWDSILRVIAPFV